MNSKNMHGEKIKRSIILYDSQKEVFKVKGNRIADILRYTVHWIYQGGLYFMNCTRFDSTCKQVISFMSVRTVWLSLRRFPWKSQGLNNIMFGSLLPNSIQTGPQNSKVRTEIPLRLHEQYIFHYSDFLYTHSSLKYDLVDIFSDKLYANRK